MRVLVIDDEARIADTLVHILELSGHKAVAAYDGDSGLRLAESFDPEFVVSDVIMTGTSGIDVAMALRYRNPAIKVLLVSGQAVTGDLVARASADGYCFELLAKPFAPEELLATLDRL